jgi:hypothetical protein
MTELYVTARDAYVHANARQALQPPSYTRDFAPAEPQTKSEYRGTLARLAAMAPGRVRVN